MIAVGGFSVSAVAGAVPAHAVDNLAALGARVGPERARAIVATTGFARRRVCAIGQTLEDLVAAAMRRLFTTIDPATVGGIVTVSFSYGRRFPTLSQHLHRLFGLPQDAAALDLALPCAGYPYGLMVAGNLASATRRRILLVDGDVQSACLAEDDVATAAVLSDAATVTCVEPGGKGATFDFLTDGARGDVLSCAASGPIRMDGFALYRFVAQDVRAFLKAFLEASSPRPPARFIPHQANLYMVRQLAKALALEDRLCTCGADFANPGSCSVPLALAADAGRQAAEDVVLAAFGAGLAAAAARLEIPGAVARGVAEV